MKTSIILLQNLNFSQRLHNRIYMIVIHLKWKCIETQMLSDNFNKQLQLLLWIQLTTMKSELSFILMWKQFSIHLCFAMIINKMQSQSLQLVKMNLWFFAFTHEQLYVILFRIVDVSNVTVLLLKVENSKTKNVVYSEVLLNQWLLLDFLDCYSTFTVCLQ